MTNRMRAERARQHFAEIIAIAEKGGVTIIEKHGRARAMIGPVVSKPVGPTPVNVADLAGSGAGLWGKDPGRLIAALREEWE
jgi:antitoxin (DNA-binding transcriptional repressor) of toxin-antitoxin stability system